MKAQVWSYGGGTQSCAIAALVIQGRLPKPDMIVIADTGREAAETWRYLDEVIRPALRVIGLSVKRVSSEELGYAGIELFNSSGSLLLPAYSNQTEEGSKLPAFCSSYWKRDVIDAHLSRVHGMTASQHVTWLGYGREEQKRWAACMVSKDYKNGLIRLPLVTDVPMRRHECQNLIASMGWPTPAPRSRCWMCPNQSDAEWRSLPAEEFQKAVALEKEMQQRDPEAWLHRSCKPLSEVDLTAPEDLFSRPCDSGNCFV